MLTATRKPPKKASRLDLQIVVEYDTPAERASELRKAAAELIELAEMTETENERTA